MRVTASVIINRPVQQVFKVYWEDHLRNQPRFYPSTINIVPLTDGPLRQGSRFSLTRKMMGRERTEIREVMEWDAPRHVVIEARSPGFSLRFTADCEGSGEGSTLFTFVGDAEVAGVRGLLAPVMRGKIQRDLQEGLDRVKQMVETET
jgi:uncharacterized protein YndB with AHSA1/START domain